MWRDSFICHIPWIGGYNYDSGECTWHTHTHHPVRYPPCLHAIPWGSNLTNWLVSSERITCFVAWKHLLKIDHSTWWSKHNMKSVENNISKTWSIKWVFNMRLRILKKQCHKGPGSPVYTDYTSIADACAAWIGLLEELLQPHRDKIQKRFGQAMTPDHFLAYRLYPKYRGHKLKSDQVQSVHELLLTKDPDLMAHFSSVQVKAEPFLCLCPMPAANWQTGVKLVVDLCQESMQVGEHKTVSSRHLVKYICTHEMWLCGGVLLCVFEDTCRGKRGNQEVFFGICTIWIQPLLKL